MKIIAELALAHEGSLGTALRMIDACADAGADAVKFQCHTGDPVNEFRPGTSFPQDESRNHYWERTAFFIDEWELLRDRAREHGVEFGASCFSMKAFHLMRGLVDFWKVGSAQLTDHEYLSAVVKTGQPLYVSTGMSSMKEIQHWVHGLCPDRLTLMQCTSAYPCPPEHIGLNVMKQLRTIAPHVGLSDHSGTIYPGILAAYLGADALEVHVCLSRWSFGPDVPASITVDELRQLVQGVRFVERMRDVDKDAVAVEMVGMRKLFRGVA